MEGEADSDRLARGLMDVLALFVTLTLGLSDGVCETVMVTLLKTEGELEALRLWLADTVKLAEKVSSS